MHHHHQLFCIPMNANNYASLQYLYHIPVQTIANHCESYYLRCQLVLQMCMIMTNNSGRVKTIPI